MKVEGIGLVELQYVHTGECFEQDGFIGIKTDAKKKENGKTYCKVVWLCGGVLGSVDERSFVRAVDAKVVHK